MRNHEKKYEQGIRNNFHETPKEHKCVVQGKKKISQPTKNNGSTTANLKTCDVTIPHTP